MRSHLPSLALLGLVVLGGCHAPATTSAEPAAPEAETEKDAGTHLTAAHAAPPKGDHAGHAKKYTVPFAAESDKDDPLALTRGYFQNVLADNATYMRTHDAGFFKGFAQTQKPRATVVACADSRVQTPAFDATPENDDFFVRNIGNQISNSEGSVEYGVHHLKTPVLMILGHTGCGAVKAAMGDYAKESDPIRHELDGLKLPKRKEGIKEEDPAVWLDGVVTNVHDQVTMALAKFDDEVAAGNLTIVGAVYDFRNDMKQGPGKIVLVNVNGHRDAAKILAFERGVQGLVSDSRTSADAGARKDVVDVKDLQSLRDALKDAKEPKDVKDSKDSKDSKDAKDPKAAHH
jgi:carbonic anhydrase